MAITISGTTGIDMGNTPVANLANAGVSDAVNKAYVDDLKIIATGTATFTATTNNINLTGIGIGVEIGDVIQISGATDAKNNSEFTIEVITNANNIIVNQAHANKGTTKNIVAETSNITVKLLAKWYNASDGLGQDWVGMTSTRAGNTDYPNNTNRTIKVSINSSAGAGYRSILLVNNVEVSSFLFTTAGQRRTDQADVTKLAVYRLAQATSGYVLHEWVERR